MANPLSDSVIIGTIGELLVQLRLLEFGIQAAPPIKDSGNDLIGIKSRIVKFIQIKTSSTTRFDLSDLPEIFDVLILVGLIYRGDRISLDESKIWALNNGQTISQKRELTQQLVDEIWSI